MPHTSLNLSVLLEAVGFAGLLLAGVYILLALNAMREGIRWFLKQAITILALYFILLAFLPAAGCPRPYQAPLAVMTAALIGLTTGKKRSRHIPAKVRRRVIERDLKGEQFDPEIHHVDHVWPFAKGGSNTTDNLRVVRKKDNLRKGSKLPRLRDF